MQRISIKMLKSIPEIKYKVEHIDDEIIVTKQKKIDWKKHEIRQGKIIIDNIFYIFFMHFNIWSQDDYKRQWKEGLKYLVKYHKSCLVQDVHLINGKPVIDWWIMYQINGFIHMQHHILVGDVYKRSVGNKLFTPDTCYDFIPNRQLHENDGEKIKEIIIKL